MYIYGDTYRVTFLWKGEYFYADVYAYSTRQAREEFLEKYPIIESWRIASIQYIPEEEF